MSRNDWAWTNKAKNKLSAEKQTALIDKNYAERVNYCIQNTILYDFRTSQEHLSPKDISRNFETNIKILDTDSVIAAKDNSDGKTVVLNFASFKNPGGLFMNGSMAQEESLCHASILYNVLRAFEDTYYKDNITMLNNALYQDRALYTPNILFKLPQNVSFLCDIITCAAPNAYAAKHYKNIANSEIETVMRNRIKTVLYICEENKAETLILGAYGCGVFGNDAEFVANCFKNELDNDYKNTFKNVIFAIPKGKNLDAFQKVFTE